MRIRSVEFVVALQLAISLEVAVGADLRDLRRSQPTQLPCGDVVGFQVLLDRQGFSPGEIDGKPGDRVSHALTAVQSARGLPVTGRPDCATWQALGAANADRSVMTTYTIIDDDLKGPFAIIPRDLAQQVGLPALSYQSAIEELGERFHASPALLRQLNPGVALVDGRDIMVPDVTPFDPDIKPAFDPTAADATIVVSRSDSALRVVRADGTVVFYAPVSTGSIHDPLPTGDYKVLGSRWQPVFHYNPSIFWDAKDGDEKAAIKPGPNNPVGVVWIALDLPHYGIHGTPEPGHIGRSESHGCVRLTNWDAARVAALVKPGTPVQFR
jgi:lipoprotein-anchoring transpeptidase ErfK/SrfK